MIEVLKALSVFFAYAVMAVFAQNAVFTRALGVSRLVKLVDDTTVDSLTFGALLCAVQLISAPLGYFVNLWLAQYPYRMYIRPLVMVLCSTVAFFIVLLVVVVFFRLHGAREIVAVLPMATFNTCILGTLFISTIQSFSLVQTMGFALGSGVGYVLAVQVVTEGGSASCRATRCRPRSAGCPSRCCISASWLWPFTALPAICWHFDRGSGCLPGNAAGGLCGFSGRVPAAEAGAFSMSGPRAGTAGTAARQRRGNEQKKGVCVYDPAQPFRARRGKILYSDVYGGGPRAAQRGVRAGAGPSAGADWAAHRAGL